MIPSTKRLKSEHGVVCHRPGQRFGYFGWPTVARLDDGTLVVASSGLRSAHVCPWGKTVLNTSRDEGRTWSEPRVINDSLIDDRDAGVLNLGGGNLLVSWFTSDTRQYFRQAPDVAFRSILDGWTDEAVRACLGSWVLLSADGGTTWSPPIRTPVTTPHGPIRLRNSDLLYLGKRFGNHMNDLHENPLAAAVSRDGGRTWTERGAVPCFPGTKSTAYHEPHVVELISGTLLGLVRYEAGPYGVCTDGPLNFSLLQTESSDGGATWSIPRPLGFHGSPPHLLRHSSGTLILSYGYRQGPYGQSAAFSRDEGRTWDHDWIIRDDGLDLDLGYPSTVELADGSLFMVYYQKVQREESCSLLWSRWRLPST
jgi:sialidase-1